MAKSATPMKSEKSTMGKVYKALLDAPTPLTAAEVAARTDPAVPLTLVAFALESMTFEGSVDRVHTGPHRWAYRVVDKTGHPYPRKLRYGEVGRPPHRVKGGSNYRVRYSRRWKEDEPSPSSRTPPPGS